MLPNEIKGLWGIELDSLVGSEIHAKYVFNRERNINSIKELFKMIKD